MHLLFAPLYRWTAVVSRWLQHSRVTACLIAGVLLSAAQNTPAQTPIIAKLPTGAQVVQGNASFAQTATHLQVTNSPGAIINWQSFNIAAGHSTYFQQLSANSSVLNQVLSNDPSKIFGTLGSNGRVILVNQSGIVVGAGAVVDTAGFIASTLGLVESNAALSRLRFAAGGQGAGSLQVDGIIRSSQGDIILIAPDVRVGPAGFVKASDGAVMLAAGQQVLLTGRSLDGISMQLQAPTDQAINLGRLEGNAVGLFASKLRNAGVIQANTAELVGGRVMLRALANASVSGTVTAAGTGASSRGGVVTVEGRDVLLESAIIDASGTGVGGKVLVGGGWQGKDASMANSQNTSVDSASSIDVSGVGNASAGTAVIWSDGDTRYAGNIDARGGALGGDGGQVEVSGKENLTFGGSARVDAPRGVAGSILLDPKNIVINELLTSSTPTGSVLFSASPGTTQTFINSGIVSLVNSLNGGTLTLQATNDININNTLNFNAVTGTVYFEAGRSINLNHNINFGNGNRANLTFVANSPNATSNRDAGAGGITFGTGWTINMGSFGTLKLLVDNGAEGGAITMGTVGSMDRLIVDNQAVAGASTGGIFRNTGSTIQNITDRVLLRTERGSIGTALTNIAIANPTVLSVAAANGDAYISSPGALFLGAAPELGGAAANVSGLLRMAGSTNNIGVRGTQSGSGAVNAGTLQFATGNGVIYSDSTNASGPLVVNANQIISDSGINIAINPLAKVATNVTVGAGGMNIGATLSINGSNNSNSAAATVTSLGDVTARNLEVKGNTSGASLALNGATGLLKVAKPTPGTSAIDIWGGAGTNAPALVTAKSIVLGTATAGYDTGLTVRGGLGANSSAELRATAGDINLHRAQTIVLGQVNKGFNSFSKVNAAAGRVNITDSGAPGSSVGFNDTGSSNYAEMTSLLGVNIGIGTVQLSSGARIVSSGPINITTTDTVVGTRLRNDAKIVSVSDINIAGRLELSAGAASIALVSTSASITAEGPITFGTSGSPGSHALIFAGQNGVAFSAAKGLPQVFAVNTGATSTSQRGVIVPLVEVAPAPVLASTALFSTQQAVQSAAQLNTLLLQDQAVFSQVSLSQPKSVAVLTASSKEKPIATDKEALASTDKDKPAASDKETSAATEKEKANELPACPR